MKKKNGLSTLKEGNKGCSIQGRPRKEHTGGPKDRNAWELEKKREPHKIKEEQKGRTVGGSQK